MQIILSSAGMNSSNEHSIWKFSVIMMGDTKLNTETIGFIMNQSVYNVDYKQISTMYGLKHTLPKVSVYCGGPMMSERATIIHSNDYKIKGTQLFNKHSSLTFNDKIVKDINAGKGPKEWKIMLGFSKWQDGQLDAEITRPGGWLTDTYDHTVWGNYRRKEKMWRRMIERNAKQQANHFLDTIAQE
jgi:putative transcriptional regulator